MEALDPNVFTIAEIEVYGDPTHGESQIVVVSHPCSAQIPVKEQRVPLSSFMADQADVFCADCGERALLVKAKGDITLQ